MKRVKWLGVLLVILSLALLPMGCDGDDDDDDGGKGKGSITFHVNINAVNSLEKGTKANPFYTIQAAVHACQGARKDCIVKVAQGVYTEEVVAHGNIAFKGGFNGDFSERDPQTYVTVLNSGDISIFWSNPGKLGVDGFVIENNFFGVVSISGRNADVTISDNLIVNNFTGLYHLSMPNVYSPDKDKISASLTIKDNVAYYNFYSFYGYAYEYPYYYGDANKVSLDVVMKYNTVYYNFIASAINGYSVYGNVKINSAISNNIFAENFLGPYVQSFSFDGNTVSKVVSNNNVSVYNGYMGMGIGAGAYYGTADTRLKSKNDTFAFNGYAYYFPPYWYIGGGLLDGWDAGNGTISADILNGIFYYTDSYYVFSGDLVIGDNVTARFSDIQYCNYYYYCYSYASNMGVPPIFNDPLNWDFTLDPTSPCIDAGKNGKDMGAYGGLGGGVIGSRTW